MEKLQTSEEVDSFISAGDALVVEGEQMVELTQTSLPDKSRIAELQERLSVWLRQYELNEFDSAVAA